MKYFNSVLRKGLLGTILSLLVLLAVGSSLLVGQETTGVVAGKVLDQSGAAVPNAKVELSGGALPSSVTVTTGMSGEFSFPAVPIGTGYQLRVTASGFRSTTRTDIVIIVGITVTVNVSLEVGQMTETVVVAANADMVDTASSSSAVIVEKGFFDILPKARGFDGLVSIAPGARNEGLAGGISIDGATGAENTFFMNGMEMEDVYGGTLVNGNGHGNQIPVEMIQQVQVKNGIMEAQYGGAMGGVVSAISRTGTNAFHGEIGIYFNNDAMQARPRPGLQLNAFNDNIAEYYLAPQDTFKSWNPIFDLGGPLWKDKAFFFIGYMPTITNTQRTVNFNTGETGTYHSKYKQQYGNARIDYNPWSKIRMNMNWVFNPNKTNGSLPATNGTSSYSTDWADLGSFNAGNMLAGQIDYLATSKLIITFRGGYTYTNYNNLYSIPLTTAIYYSGHSTTIPPANLQGPNGWVVSPVASDNFDIFTRHNYSADASYIVNWHGQHTIKGGWQYNGLANNVLESSYSNGYYRYYWGSTYHCQTKSCAETGAYGYYRYRVLGTIGHASSNNQAMFLQDDWRVNKHLSINYGLRTEHEKVPAFSSGTSTPSPAITFDWTAKMSPRVGVAFDPKGDGKQKFFGGWDWSYDIMKYSLPQGSFGGQVWQEWYYTLDDPNLVTKNQGFPADPYKLPGTLIEWVNYRIPSSDPSQHLIDPNLKPMKQQMIDFGYERSLSPTLVASARYTDRRLIHTIEDIGYVVANGGETYNIGNPGYGTVANAQNWANWMGVSGIPPTPKAVRDYDAVEIRLDKRFSRSYQFTASYTWSRTYGNYSGLASSDEGGRDDPDNSRYFDQPWIYGDAKGHMDIKGLMPTDRPNTFKFFGGYIYRSKLGATTLSPIISLYQGTPLSSEVQLIDTQGWVFYNGRGDMGRTPFYPNVDANLMHDFPAFKGHESWKLRFEFSVFNLFNNDTITSKYTLYSHTNDGPIGTPDSFPDVAHFVQSVVTNGVDVKGLMAAQGIRVDPQYGLANGFQGPRYCRLQLKFSF